MNDGWSTGQSTTDRPSDYTTPLSVEDLQTHFTELRPLLQHLALDSNHPDRAYRDYQQLPPRVKKVVRIDDMLHASFTQKGWILIDEPRSTALQTVQHLVSKGRFQDAERRLLSYFDDDTIESLLDDMNELPMFQPMASMALKAFEDHKAPGKSAAPSLLALAEVVVQQVYMDHHGGVHVPDHKMGLLAWEAFAENVRGLRWLKQALLMRSHAPPATDDGGDGHQDIKAWATLFAVGEWALRSAQHAAIAPDDRTPRPGTRML